MGFRIYGLLCLALLIAALASCNGRTITPPPDDFTRLTAQVLDATGAPLSGLNVRVEGRDTGLVTGVSGEFTLNAGDFPNGVNSANEILIGRGGVVIGSEVIVPVDNPDITIRFNNNGTGTATINGVAVNETTGAGLTGVQVTLFSVDGGVLQTTSVGGGTFTFSNVPAGSWQLVGFLNGYQPEMAFIGVKDGETLNYSLTLSPDGQIRPGEGVVVSGTLTDSKTGAPIAGAFVSVMADTGYMGIPEPGVWDDVKGEPAISPDGTAGGGSSEPGREGSMFAPWRYDPQYQETTTAADGSFEFPDEVIGYSLYFSYNADGYLAGSHYQSLEGASGEVAVDLTLEPIVPTDISGIVRNGDGQPVEGAYVEFIFSGGFGGGPEPMPMPPVMDLGQWAADGSDVRGNVGAPPPPMMPGSDGAESGGAGWDDFDSAPGAPTSGGGNGDSDMDSQLMQKFRFEQQQNRGTSDIAGFDGYLAVTTGPDGAFSFEDVPAGPYYMIASAYRHLPYSSEYTATEEGPNEVEIVIEEIPVGSVEGVVTDEDGTPLDDVLVNAIQPNVDPFTYTDASGRYRIDNVPVGLWTVSGYKQGYLTVSHETDITEGGVATVNIQINSYTPPPATLIPFTGRILDGTKFDDQGRPSVGSGISNADVVFTPVDNNYGHYVQHSQSDSDGNYGVGLINNLDYNLLIQAVGFQDMFTRIWVDSQWPMFDYSLWPVNGPSWGGGGVTPGGIDPATGVETEPAPDPNP